MLVVHAHEQCVCVRACVRVCVRVCVCVAMCVAVCVSGMSLRNKQFTVHVCNQLHCPARLQHYQ